ncbi:hypothetical protein B0A48_17331 [Cryoendolithus antarcticus]|uniref:Uncharacterized protein n=1 Tax=Cryoendolithus antarcticus TaxID=1507870 RepID=A0A1V8SD01_9PEZI|nr:hypothetical protein B0A48_17331 [Cryoendolithus antarcticus]
MTERSDSIQPIHAGHGRASANDADHATMTLDPGASQQPHPAPERHTMSATHDSFANPTPLALMGFVISTFTFAMVLMDLTGNALDGMLSKPYNATLAIYAPVWGFAILTFFVFTLGANAVLAAVFFLLWAGAFSVSGAYWCLSLSKISTAQTLKKAGSALCFAAAALGWYYTVAVICAELTSFELPRSDLSRLRRAKKKSALPTAERGLN